MRLCQKQNTERILNQIEKIIDAVMFWEKLNREREIITY